MIKLCRYFIVLTLLAAILPSQTRANDSLRNEVSIDVANILTFLSLDKQSYLVNYRLNLSDKWRLRSGLDFELSNFNDKGLYLDIYAGADQKIYSTNRFIAYYGIDGSISLSRPEFQSNRNTRYGISPLIGACFFLTRHLSISTEPRLNFFYYRTRNPSSFNPDANTDNYEIGIGTVGLLLIGFHF